jgi:hypothetical protein
MSKLRNFIDEITQLATSHATRDQQYEIASAQFEKVMSELREYYEQESLPVERMRGDLSRLEDELIWERKKLHQLKPAHALLGHVQYLARNARGSL